MAENRTKSGLIVPGGVPSGKDKPSVGSPTAQTPVPVIDGFPLASQFILCREVHVIAKRLEGNSLSTVIFSLVGATPQDMDANLCATFYTDYNGAMALGRELLKHATQIPLLER